MPIELSPALVGTLIHFPFMVFDYVRWPSPGCWPVDSEGPIDIQVGSENILWWNFCRHNSSLLLVSDPNYIISEPSSTGSESGRLEHAHMAFDVS